MVDVVPFHGLRYDENKSGPLSQLIAPPYDVIRPDLQEDLYGRNPHNVVRLILGKQYEDDTGDNNRYTRSAGVFRGWRGSGVLKTDPEPSFYVYSQEYTFNGQSNNRVGFFARVRLEDFSEGNICPHEFTLAKAKKDRANLIRACRANFSPVFGLFSDPEGVIDRKLADATQGAPLAEIEEDGVTHRMWRVTDPATLEFLTRAFEEKKVYIADGHHRYETSLAYHREHGGEVPDSAHVMMFLTNLDAQSLAIYPIHRQLKCPQPFDRNAFVKQLEPYFSVEALAKNQTADQLTATLEEAGKKGTAFCAYLGGGDALLLSLKDHEKVVPFMEEDAPDLKVLDVYQLHTLVLRQLLDIDTRKPEHQQYITYNVRTGEAMANVDAGKFDLVIFMNATRMDQVRDLAERGIRLPQKATYFYPKLLSGLVINPFQS
ncbi:MAG: DUF1015 family protein [Nitrospinaceae bacterium]|nr:DUF1015 domain-containing protein [Nitrospinaceae bacterium]NIR53530.1 DUF1015 domain-containing protein [Nitrospinaceae bacterium]NIS83931.1 DUF1015 domain-containing protein [Nitrospinaceae bacterium]NIT80740.1 DUF1015 domain-containing protein [Nitrospinaceae bacterium]NIU43046.1 DUF1015 domain-containing protein [Nitrospinaceae bacterium]